MYSVRALPPEDVLKSLVGYDARTATLLYARGITEPKTAEVFLSKKWNPMDPYRYADMKKAVERTIQSLQKGGTVGIYSDYDCDGIPAAAALHSTLRALGHAKLHYFVPDRNSDRFGLNERGVQEMAAAQADVVFVLDCGTSDPEHMALMRQKGMDVIVLDHHLPGDVMPEPFAMVNPTLEEGIPKPYPCAAGVTYVFLQALVERARQVAGIASLPVGWEKWQLDLISLATLSDAVPLRGLNRQFVHYGLEVARKSPRPGMQALCARLKLRQSALTQEDFSFLIIPRINAASRMGNARTAFSLLTTDDLSEAYALVDELTRLNNKRKSAVAAMTRRAHTTAKVKLSGDAVWVFGDREWTPSLAGLVAQKVSEEYDKTVFVWGQSSAPESLLQGSCRSKKHDTFSMMQEVSDIFLEHGGHRQAGGFTLAKGAEVVLEKKLNAVADAFVVESGVSCIDFECRIADTAEVFRLSEHFSPFGMENDAICVAVKDCSIEDVQVFGKTKNHVRLTLKDSSGTMQGIRFFIGKAMLEKIQEKASMTVVGSVEWDSFRKKIFLRIMQVV